MTLQHQTYGKLLTKSVHFTKRNYLPSGNWIIYSHETRKKTTKMETGK
jgi:hypothetical protein